MYNLENLFIYMFVLSCLNLFYVSFKVVKSLLQEIPKPLDFSNGEILLFWILFSYFITFIIT